MAGLAWVFGLIVTVGVTGYALVTALTSSFGEVSTLARVSRVVAVALIVTLTATFNRCFPDRWPDR